MNSARPQNTPVASKTNPSSSKNVRDEGRTALDFSITVRAGLASDVLVDTEIPRKPLIQHGRAERLLRRRAPTGEVRARSGARSADETADMEGLVSKGWAVGVRLCSVAMDASH